MSSNDSNTSWRLRFEDRDDYLYAEVSGPEDSMQISLAYWRAIEAECERRKTTRLLVCDRLRGQPSSQTDSEEIANALGGGIFANMRIAFHEPVAEHLRFLEYGEMAVREVGVTMRVFPSDKEAEVWLRYGQQ
ncbi:MAG: hypothetical protein ABI304_05455 [Rudaea sp.]